MGTRSAWLRTDDGFTLIELIVGMVIGGIIIGAIAAALIVSFRTADVTQQRMSESHDAQVTSAYLANDVQSAAVISVASGGASCASATQLVSFTYAGSGKVATYACGPASGETRVTRTFDGTTVVLAHFAGSAKPTVTCAGCGTSAPARVEIAFTEASGYSYTLVGSQRFTDPGSSSGSGIVADVTLFVLGGGSPLWVSGSCPPGQIDNPGNQNNDCTADSESGGQPTNPKLTILGNLYVNSSANGAVRLSGKKSDVRLNIVGGDFGILAGGTCAGCTPKTVVCPACRTDPPPSSYSPALLDPLRFMTAPDETGLPHFADGNYHGPGVYDTRTLGISANTTFAAGTYILNNGISVTGSATVSGSGVTLYNKVGGINFAGSSTISLSPPTSGQYKGILIFQSRTNTSALTLAGGTGISPIGIIYAPLGNSVTLGTGGASLRVTAVIAQNIKVSGNAQVTIG